MVWPKEQMVEPQVYALERPLKGLHGLVLSCQLVCQLAPLAALDALVQLGLPGMHHHKLSYWSICRERKSLDKYVYAHAEDLLGILGAPISSMIVWEREVE